MGVKRAGSANSSHQQLFDENLDTRNPQQAENSQASDQDRQVSLKHYLYDMQLSAKQEDSEDTVKLKKVCTEVVKLLWQFSIQQNDQSLFAEERSNLPMNIQMLVIETLCQILNLYLPSSSFFFMQACIKNIKSKISTLKSQMILQKLIDGVQFPIRDIASKGQQIDTEGIRLPRNKQELIMALDTDLDLIN